VINLNIRVSIIAADIFMANSKPSCFFCDSKRQRNLILVGEDAPGNPELIDYDGMGVHEISIAIKYRDMQEKKEVVAMQRMDGDG
jgi:hypothetical protein